MNLNIVIDSLMEQVRKLTCHMIKHATFDKTYTGKIVSANGNKYRVMIKDKEHSTTSPLTFYIGENVKVTAIQNNFNDLYIHPKASVYDNGDNGISDQLNQLQQSINLVQQNVNQLNLDLQWQTPFINPTPIHTLTRDNTWAAPQNCLIAGWIKLPQAVHVNLAINSARIIYYTNDNCDAIQCVPVQFYVKKGQLITFSTAASGNNSLDANGQFAIQAYAIGS